MREKPELPGSGEEVFETQKYGLIRRQAAPYTLNLGMLISNYSSGEAQL